jgi:ABC-type nitrate/sulfonate/bicarbonate transport system ATPase subunit
MINQFGNQLTNDGNEYFYVINGSWCAKGLETVYPTGNQLLSTFGFSNSQHDMNADIYALWTGALYCTALAFGVLVASAQAPYYSAAWQRFCQVSPLGLVAALFAAGFKALGAQFGYLLGRGASGGDSGGSGAGGSGGGRGDAGASLASAGGDSLVSNSSFVSTSSPTRGPAFEKLAAHESGGPHHHDLDTDNDSQEGGGGVVNRNRTVSEGSGSFEVASDDEYEADEFPDQPRRRVVSFQDEDPEALAAARSQEDEEEEADNHGSSSSSNRYARAKQHSPAAAAGSPESMASSSSSGGGGGGQGQWPANDEDDGEDEARKKALKALLRRQLRNPLGGDDAAGVRRNPEHLAPPMVLSFHSICLSVPHPPNLSKSLKRMTGADILDKEQTAVAAAAAQQQMGGSGNASPMEVVPLSATLDASEAGLGMNVMRHPQSGLAVVRKVMPGSWAQRKGVRPGDSVVGVGATRVTNYDQLTPTLRSAPRPVRVHFLRRRKAAATLSAEAAAARQAKLFRGSAWGDRLSGLASAVGLGGPRYDPFGGPQNHKALKPILKSVSGSTLSSHRVVKPPPSSSSSMGGHGKGGVPQLRSLIAPSAQASAQAHAQATASAQATAAVRASERLPAMVCGIMGPSGAGKTSLLDVLAGRKTVGTVTGVVRLNGRAMSPKEMRLLSGYVVQEDILPAMLTVRECLDFQARLRVPSSVPGGASGRVEAVLKRMKLVRTASTIVGGSFQRGISGGEKRRLSVAIELLSEPAVLFLDEPTTGQDSTTAVMLCKALKKIARVNKG